MNNRYALILLGLCISSSGAYAQTQYASSELEEIGLLLANRNISHKCEKDTLTDKIMHLGLPLFNMSGNDDVDAVLRYIERVKLHKKLLPAIEAKYLSDDDKIKENGLLTIGESPKSDYSIDNNGTTITVSCGGWCISFPNSFSQIYGLNKKESDDYIYYGLMDRKPLPQKQNTITVGDSIVKRIGESYMIQGINTDKFYIRSSSSDSLVPVYSKEFPIETISNQLLSVIDSDMNLDIIQRLYGYKKRSFSLPMSVLADYCAATGCRPYIGIESADDREIKAVLVYRNNFFSYNHLLYMTIAVEDIAEKESRATADFYTYIPTHNLKSLFSEYE
ncbi:MAG: hypothetical protein K1W14_00435 [Muribaculaceae bacterium]